MPLQIQYTNAIHKYHTKIQGILTEVGKQIYILQCLSANVQTITVCWPIEVYTWGCHIFCF